VNDSFAPGLLRRLSPTPRSVVVVRASRIGDFLCATPALRALRVALPDASITLVALPMVRPLAERCSSIDHFEEFPGFPGIAEQFFEARRTAGFLGRMQAQRFDLAVQMHGSGVCANPFTLLLGARATAGFIRAGDAPGPLDAALPMPSGVHEVTSLLALTTFLGAPPRGRVMEFRLWPDDLAQARRLLAGAPRPLIGLQPGARTGNKRWPAHRFASAGRALKRRHGGTIVVIGGPDERAAAERIAQGVGSGSLVLAGPVPLAVMGAAIAHFALLVTNDSGPAHMAYALGVPTITIFGGTEPTRWGPPPDGRHRVLISSVPCRPCEYDDCPIGARCLHAVSERDVLTASGELMRRCWEGKRAMGDEGPERPASRV
jgi:ADP-heptose:LPS heptosyltransferase